MGLGIAAGVGRWWEWANHQWIGLRENLQETSFGINKNTIHFRYPLVKIQKAIEHGPVEIVDLPC